MIHLVNGKIMIDCSGCCSRVEIAMPQGTVECPWCHQEVAYNTRMNKFRFRQLKRKAREQHEGKPRRGGKKSKYVFSPEMIDELRRKYDSQGTTINELAMRFDMPGHIIKNKARNLGITRAKTPMWTSEDDNFLMQNYHLLSLSQLRKHLTRSETAIRLRAKRIGIKKSGPGFTARSLGEALGVDCHKVVEWFDAGWLKGRGRGTLCKNDYYYFDPEDVRDFILRHPYEVDLRLAEPLTFIEILAGVKIQDEAIFQKPEHRRAS